MKFTTLYINNVHMYSAHHTYYDDVGDVFYAQKQEV